ncbi:hypothetical protein B0H65DRAFT_472076 [Neurospora tetraspora]|uniref:Secreted protein n=1 Tax=Neurospora tetraspora TaxID=94610 RepID=A0AAE0MPP3_9PEZI|nr:hypothetical protein B0H65DRAFT_472076 [Neurospora tetraspora]
MYFVSFFFSLSYCSSIFYDFTYNVKSEDGRYDSLITLQLIFGRCDYLFFMLSFWLPPNGKEEHPGCDFGT